MSYPLTDWLDNLKARDANALLVLPQPLPPEVVRFPDPPVGEPDYSQGGSHNFYTIKSRYYELR